MGLTFLKADHNKNSEGLFEFQPTNAENDFKSLYTHGALKDEHFCFSCIAKEDIPENLENTQFCITAVLPSSTLPVNKSVNAFFFITFMKLETCLQRVKAIIKKMGLEGRRIKKVPFRFSSYGKDSALEVVILNQPADGYIRMSGENKIYRCDVDFFVKGKISAKTMKKREKDDLYPPRFEMFFVSSKENATFSGGKIAFRGATSGIKFDIHLDSPETPRPVAASAATIDASSQTEDQLDVSSPPAPPLVSTPTSSGEHATSHSVPSSSGGQLRQRSGNRERGALAEKGNEGNDSTDNDDVVDTPSEGSRKRVIVVLFVFSMLSFIIAYFIFYEVRAAFIAGLYIPYMQMRYNNVMLLFQP
ncbi:hypothetical protein GBAR_LOCUS14554 [Geodia barretti]|uniref:Uncharacterized protein n=1 Tax=Geodia barretti TaxID=519541 RepID=A0AA35SA90_GEOBA|nr:hypothetical protein GBAR_LOCUS14554 [Geodia barretti]